MRVEEEKINDAHPRRAGGGAPADDRASCLFDLMSFISHISCVGPAAFCRFLHVIALPWRTTPHACGSWLWGRLGFLDAKVSIHFFPPPCKFAWVGNNLWLLTCSSEFIQRAFATHATRLRDLYQTDSVQLCACHNIPSSSDRVYPRFTIGLDLPLMHNSM